MITETDDNYFRKLESMKRNNDELAEGMISLEAALKVQRGQKGPHASESAGSGSAAAGY